MEKGKQLLREVQALLEEAGLNTSFLPEEDGGSVEQLLIYGGKDASDRTQLIAITLASYVSPNFNNGKHQQGEMPAFKIQIDAGFPFDVADIACADVAQFLHFINLQVELPGFYLDHLHSKIIYRYVHLLEGEHLPKQTLLAIIGIVLFLQDVFWPSFERIAGGKITFTTLMEEILKSLVPES